MLLEQVLTEPADELLYERLQIECFQKWSHPSNSVLSLLQMLYEECWCGNPDLDISNVDVVAAFNQAPLLNLNIFLKSGCSQGILDIEVALQSQDLSLPRPRINNHVQACTQ